MLNHNNIRLVPTEPTILYRVGVYHEITEQFCCTSESEARPCTCTADDKCFEGEKPRFLEALPTSRGGVEPQKKTFLVAAT